MAVVDWTFVNARGRGMASSQPNPRGSGVPVAWYDEECAAVRARDLRQDIVEWLDAHCPGAWAEVFNREYQDLSQITFEREVVNRWVDGGMDPVDHPMRITRELAFRRTHDAMLFKLVWA